MEGRKGRCKDGLGWDGVGMGPTNPVVSNLVGVSFSLSRCLGPTACVHAWSSSLRLSIATNHHDYFCIS